MNQQTFDISEQRIKEREIEKDLGKAVMSWLADGNDLAAKECDVLVESLLATKEPTVRAYFIAAQVAHLRDKPQTAISSLEKAIEKYPDDKAPIRIDAPTKIVGYFWIANIARQSGNVERSRKAYETLLVTLGRTETSEGVEGKVALTMICQLYLAEIESGYCHDNEKALSYLRAIEESERPSSSRGDPEASFDLRKSWAGYESTRITKGTDKANLELSPVSDSMSAYVLAVHHLFLNGISGEPLAGSRKGMNIVMDRLIGRTVRGEYSRIDKDLARLGYGYDQQHKGNIEKAEEYFSSLFQDDSFFSPVAGMSLARSKKAQSKSNEADQILGQLGKKYPRYESAVSQLRQSFR